MTSDDGVSPTGQEGLTLVEVVVALLVLSVGLLAVAGMTTAVGSQARTATLHTDRALLAQERLGRVAADGWDGNAVGTAVDTVARGSRSWIVTTSVTQPEPRLKEVSVTVELLDGSADRSFSVRVAKPRPLPN